MDKYLVLEHPALGKKVIKQGVYIWALVFGPLWMLYHGMWVRFLGIVIGILMLQASLYEAGWESSEIAINIVVCLCTGAWGWKLLLKQCLSKGYAVVNEVTASSVEAAWAAAYHRSGE